jgi:hypothetical protein
MNQRFFGMLLAPLLALTACSSSSDDSGDGLQAPNLNDVMPMVGGLHVTWENKQTDCDAIEVERMAGSKAYELAFSLPGSADNKHDDTASDTTITYAYRLRCKKGAAYSAYSNEKSGSPTK